MVAWLVTCKATLVGFGKLPSMKGMVKAPVSCTSVCTLSKKLRNHMLSSSERLSFPAGFTLTQSGVMNRPPSIMAKTLPPSNCVQVLETRLGVTRLTITELVSRHLLPLAPNVPRPLLLHLVASLLRQLGRDAQLQATFGCVIHRVDMREWEWTGCMDDSPE